MHPSPICNPCTTKAPEAEAGAENDPEPIDYTVSYHVRISPREIKKWDFYFMPLISHELTLLLLAG